MAEGLGRKHGLTNLPRLVRRNNVHHYMKDDTGTTKFLADAIKEMKDCDSLKDKMRFIANVFLTHRQKGKFEALYSMDPSSHLTDFNIKMGRCHVAVRGTSLSRGIFPDRGDHPGPVQDGTRIHT